MPVVDGAAAPAMRNIVIGGYGPGSRSRSLSSGARSRDPLAHLSGTTEIVQLNFQTAKPIPNAHAHSRCAMRPSCACTFRPGEGVGNAGCPPHPQPRVQSVGGTRVSSPPSHRDTRHSRTRAVLTAYFVLSPVIGLSCHRRRRKLLPLT